MLHHSDVGLPVPGTAKVGDTSLRRSNPNLLSFAARFRGPACLAAGIRTEREFMETVFVIYRGTRLRGVSSNVAESGTKQ